MEQVCFKTFKPVANVISKYMLLSELDVKEGQITKKGEGTSKLTYQGLPITVENDEKKLKERGKTINKYGKPINTIDGQKKKSSGFKRIEFLDRSIKKNWKKYMLENPFYFKEVFNKDLNRKNLIKAANEMFGERIV